jgi:hypothetical protein
MRDGLLWKEDVRNAFGQVTLDTDSAMRSCLYIPVPEPARAQALAASIPVPAYLIVILLWCYFGWCGASLAYGLLGALIDLHIRGAHGPAIRGVISTYVDDVAGFGHPTTVRADQAHARTTITAILGPDGLADKSLLPCSAGEIIGWYVDLLRLTILPSAKGRRKLLWTFFTLDVTAKKWPLRQCQLLASLAQRYHVAIQGMAPYVFPFEALLAGTSPGPRKVTSAARQAAEMWRAVAVLLLVCPAAMAMPIPRFLRLPSCPHTTRIEAHTDAGPTHLGLKLVDPLTQKVHLHTSFALPCSMRRPRYITATSSQMCRTTRRS